MATMTHAESRRLYSWWWDSHISPKNSKWLQENLTDMDVKVKSMIKLIEEDADSFARRAEMYYKKRPELMKLVEEFYRAYRSLAERYDHATGALRQAHRTMAEAFPNQVPFALTDDSPSGSSTPEGEPRTPEMPPPIRAFVEPDDLQTGALGQSSHFHAIKRNGAYSEENDTLNSKRGLKQVNEMFASGEATSQSKFAEGKVRKGLNFHEEEGKIHESKIHNGATDIQKNDKGDKHDAYEKTKVLQGEVSQLSSENQNLKMQIKSEQDRVTKCENEIQRLQASLSKSEADKDIALLECQKLLEKISNLEVEISHIHEDNRKLNNEMVIKLARLESAEGRCLQLETEKQTLEMEVQDLAQQANERQQELQQKQDEMDKLKCSLQEEHNRYTQAEAALHSLENLHSQSLEKLSITASELQNGVEKLKDMELRNCSLEEDIQQVKEVNSNLNKELKLKEEELKKLNISMQDEHLLSVKTEEALQCLEKLHSQSQEEIRILTLDVHNKVDMLKDMELKNQQLEEEVQQLNEKNGNLNEQVLSSALTIKNLQEEILNLKEALDKLENEVERHLHENKALQRELHCVREELTDLDLKHQRVFEQIEAVGLNKDSFQVSVRELQDGNLELKELCRKHEDVKAILINKLENMEKVSERNILLEISLSDATVELEGLREKVNTLEECCESLTRRISHLASEKSSLVCQLESITHNTEKLSENNTFLENSLSDANVELEGLREKLKSLEESSQSLCNENSNLLSEKILLISQMESLGTTLENMNKSFAELEDKHLYLEREKESTVILLSELQNQLKIEQREHEAFVLSSNTQLATSKDQISLLEEESRSKDKELEGLLDKLLNWEMQTFLSQKCLLDSQECSQKNLASARHTKKLLSDQIRLIQQEHKSLVLSSNSQLASLAGQISLVQQESESKDKELEVLQHKLLNCELQVIELQNLLKLEQYEREAFVLSSNTHLGTLEDRISLLEEESQSKDKEFEMLQHKLLSWEMWAFMLQSCLLDSKEWSQKRLASARCTEKLLSDKVSLFQQEHQAFVLSSNSQLATLAGQISLIQQEGQSKDKELEGLHHKLLNCELQAFVLQKCLLELKLWSQKHLELSRHVEKLLTDVKQENIGQKKMIEYISENYRKLQEGIQMVLTSAGVKDTCESDGTPDESQHQHILDKIKEAQNFISDTIDENHFLLLEKSVIITLLQQLGLDLSILKLENNALDQEYKIRTQQLLAVKTEKLELLQINENLRQVIHAGYLREDTLKTETDILGKQLLDLHKTHKDSQAEICILLEENRSLTNEVSGLRDEMQNLEEENCVIFAEAINLSCLSLIFEQFGSERAMNLKICSTDLDSLYRANNVLENKLAEMIQKIELIEAENMLLKSSAIKLDDCQGHLLMLQDDLNMASSVHEQLNHQIEQLRHQIETGNSLLIQRDLELTEANKKVEEKENEKINLYKDIEVIKMEFDEIIGVRKELEKKIRMLIDDNSQKDNKIAHIHEENQMLNAVIQNLRNGLVELRASKEHLASELTYEIKLYEEEVARLWSDNHISTVHVEIFEEKMLELIGDCESLEISAIMQRKILEEQIASNHTYTDQLNQKLDSLERESRTLKDKLNAYLSLVLSLQNSITSLENQTVSLMEHHEMNYHSGKDASIVRHKHVKSIQQLSMDIVELDGVLKLQKLQARIEELQKVLMEYCNILSRESDVDAKSSAVEMEIVVSKPERTLDEEEIQLKENTITAREAEVRDAGKNVELQPTGAERSKGGYGPMVKDIQLDQSSFDAGSGLYKKVGVEDVETDDQMLKLWETAESDYNNEMFRPSSITTADDIICHQIEAVEEQKSKYPSESVAEKELGVDKLGMPKKVDPHQQWNKGILECFASDAQRLSILQNSVQELKMQLENTEKSDTSTNMKYDTMKGQLKRAEEAISELVDINTNLTKKAEDCSTSFDGKAGEQEGVRNQQKGKVSDHPQRGLEKIGRLELELQKIQYILLKLNEERENRIRAAQGRPRVILRDFLYGRREGYRRKRAHFCGCIRPKTSGD